MKIRSGFVSNSSSSSFIIFGLDLGEDENEIAQRLDRALLEEFELITESGEIEEIDTYDLQQVLDEKVPKGVDVHATEYGSMYIGADWSSVKDDETGLQFKQRVLAEIKKIFPTVEFKELETHDIEC